MSKTYLEFQSLAAKVADLQFSKAVLDWDQQTYIPKKGGEFRSRQQGTLAEIAHGLFTGKEMADRISACAHDSELTEDQKINVELYAKDIERAKKLSGEWVAKAQALYGKGYSTWIDAREAKNFKVFLPVLQEIVDLKRKEADLFGYDEHPYEALVHDYEPNMKVKTLESFFQEMKVDVFPLFSKVMAKHSSRSELLTGKFPIPDQISFSENMIRQMGFDFDRGRHDFTTHPFCTTFGPDDVRITLRGTDQEFSSLFFGAVHEAGHALYEMGLPMKDHYGLPLGSSQSLSIHESQSRFWENNIARSEEFWAYAYPILQKKFPETLRDVNAKSWWAAINHIEPSFVRVEADELTYHVHIYIRYQVEKKWLEGSLKVSDTPEFWAEQYEAGLGIRPKDDLEGCLQDVHWSGGGIGYFPTYSLGSMIAAGIYQGLKKESPDMMVGVRSGNLAPIRKFLQERIHQHGRRHSTEKLVELAAGSTLSVKPFVNYVHEKFGLN